jgi:cytochrome bd-type quinol oxidase subunit 2
MLTGFPEIYGDSPEVRMMFRANHIYILFAALINILLGVLHFEPHTNYKNTIRIVSSLLILIGSGLLVTAFFTEPPSASFERQFTFFGVVFHLAGIVLTAFIQIFPIHKKYKKP